MEFTITQIANLVGGIVEGNGNLPIKTFAKIEDGKSGSISFLSNLKYESHLYTTESSAVLVQEDFSPKFATKACLIKVKDPYLALSQLMSTYQNMTKKAKIGLDKLSFIDDSSKISQNVYIGAFAYISENVVIESNTQIYPQSFIGNNSKIGKNCIIYSGVKIYDNCVIGDNCIIHAGVIIGSDGFGFAPDELGIFKDIPQLGNVIIKDNVSIGANTTIDRATMGSTIINKGVKLDNQVQVAHNVEIGENTVIAAQTAVAGSTKIGKNCMVGGQVGIGGHISIADGTKLGGQTGVSKSITTPNQAYSGRPLLPIKEHLKLLVNLRKLNDKK